MSQEDTSMTFRKLSSELDDPINGLLGVINTLVDLESQMEFQNTAIEGIQERLRRIIDLLEVLKK
jgi:hypothetical protein